MIFGKRHAERRDTECWHRRFAYLPVELEDGRWLWWDYYDARFSRATLSGIGVHLTKRWQCVEVGTADSFLSEARFQPPPPKK